MSQQKINTYETDAPVDLDELNSVLRNDAIKTRAAQAYAKILERERIKESKVDPAKIDEFAAYVYPVYASHLKTKGEMINLIFDKNEIDSSEKGFLMREMAIAVKRTIPEYRDRTIDEMMDIVSQWIYDANKLRVATRTGNKIHPTEKGGHYKFRWHVMYFEGDYEKQKDNLTVRVQSADNTLRNRKNEWVELEQKKLEPDPLVVTVSQEHKEGSE
jgi:hypothetical protein